MQDPESEEEKQFLDRSDKLGAELVSLVLGDESQTPRDGLYMRPGRGSGDTEESSCDQQSE